jgi:hypothetical protein
MKSTNKVVIITEKNLSEYENLYCVVCGFEFHKYEVIRVSGKLELGRVLHLDCHEDGRC